MLYRQLLQDGIEAHSGHVLRFSRARYYGASGCQGLGTNDTVPYDPHRTTRDELEFQHGGRVPRVDSIEDERRQPDGVIKLLNVKEAECPFFAEHGRRLNEEEETQTSARTS